MNSPLIIFLIEDSKIVSELLTSVIEKSMNVHIFQFNSCEKAHTMLDIISPDLLLLDYNLNSWNKQNMNGKEFLKQLNQEQNQIPSIILSGQKENTLAVELLQLGAIDYVSKNDEDFLTKTLESIEKTVDYLLLKQQKVRLSKKTPSSLLLGVSLTAFIASALLLFLFI